MLRILIMIAFAAFALPGPAQAQPNSVLHVASFNVHYMVPGDKGDDWARRKHAVTRVLKEMDADIVAFQEMETFEGGHYSRRNVQLEWIRATTAGYDVAATGDPADFPNTQPILFKADKYVSLDQGFFFFSDTPDQIYSKQWDGGYPYFCSWAMFRNQHTQQAFYVFNVHNDYKSRDNRLKTSKLIAERIRQTVPANSPVIVLGDFNAPKRHREIRLLETVGIWVVPTNGSTNRIFGMHLLPAIDHILISRQFRPQSAVRIWRNRYEGVYPADHYPISVVLEWNDPPIGSRAPG